jgi:hypothetical protein
MQLERLEEVWRSQHSVSVDTGWLLRMLRRSHRNFRATIIWRDLREVGAAWICAAFFVYLGVTSHLWSWLVLTTLTAGVGLFMLIDRLWRRATSADRSDSLADCARGSLAEVNHQAWLLRNVFWWYLLPPGIGLAAVAAEMAYQLWQRSGGLLLSAALAVCFCLIVVVVDVFIYRINQRTVRDGLEPRVRELEDLLNSLQETHADSPPD